MSFPQVTPAKLYEIKYYPDPILEKQCNEVLEITEDIKQLIQNMFITMYHNKGVGLSANQVGVSKQIFVMDTSNDGNGRKVFINPKILEADNISKFSEGCLSFPRIHIDIDRPTKIKVSALNENGEYFELELEGIEAICFQHEYDHLCGITFLNSLSQLKKTMITKKLQKWKKSIKNSSIKSSK